MNKVELLSKEIIKPSSPTPQHLKTYNLSLLDQLTPSVYVQGIVFYPSGSISKINGGEKEIFKLLKKSLSETLTLFYPFAGRIKDNIIVDCNDKGIEYYEAKVNGDISDYMSSDVLYQMFPSDIVADNMVKDTLLVIQVNMFNCGGIAISGCVSHKLADGLSVAALVNAWAASALGGGGGGVVEGLRPTFDSASHFPPKENIPNSIMPADLLQSIGQGSKIVSKRFIIDGSKLSTLRSTIMDMSSDTTRNEHHLTSVEAVTALLWKSVMEVSKLRSATLAKPIPISVVNLGVNLRKRMQPPLPSTSFGNIVTVASATSMNNSENELDVLVGQVRESISKINNEYIQYMGSGGFLKSILAFANLNENGNPLAQNVEVYWISSVCKVPIYEIDFGWGKPELVSSGASQPYQNVFLLMDTKCGNGVEVQVNMTEEDMALFETNQGLLEFASVSN
ncbi:hypothetical protein MKX01_016562 [Papaver californicum]|nr:hypothetical protein MKX01_041191 [Papaver californicum]KAI3987658.1 hypothetical protein MKX01_016562 [Papaver californicum]